MTIVGVQLDLFLQGCSSLKEKRAVLRSLKDKLPHKFRAAVSEVGFQDLHQRALIGVAIIGDSASEVRQRAQNVQRYILEKTSADLISAVDQELNFKHANQA